MSNLIFQNYHKHTYWSNIKVADSATSYEEYCQRAVELGHGIISSLEHGWQGHYIECHQLAEKYNLKFLFGTEAYWVKDRFYLDEKGHKDGANCHICLLAMNENGRQAINDILSQSAEEGMDSFYRQSRIDLSLIKSLPAEDVICTSSCAAFWKYEDSDDIVLELKEHFGKNFFLEVQYHNTEAQIRLNRHIKSLKDKYDIQLIMGCDSHYIDEKGRIDREELIKSKRGDEKVEFNKKKEALENDLKRGKITNKDYDSALEELVKKMNEKSDLSDEEGWYMDYPDGETAYQRFADQCVLNHEEILQAINNTNIFLKVEEYDSPIFNHDIKMPSLYGDLTQQERDSKFEKLIWDKWSIYKKEVPAERYSEYEEQIRYELDIVKKTFHSDYFLLDYAITQLGKKKGGQLTLTGRGCFVGEALVLTDTGYKCIKDIKVGDKVVCKTGEFTEVADTFKYDIDEELVQVKYLGSCNKVNPVICTTDHKFLTYDINTNQEVWKTACDLIPDKDYVCFPKIKTHKSQNKVIDLNDYNIFGFKYDDNYIYEIYENIGKPYKYSPSDVARHLGCGKSVIEKYANGKRTHFKARNGATDKDVLLYTGFSTAEEYREYVLNKKIKRINRYLPLDYIMGEFIGMMYGDGYTNKSKMEIGFAINPISQKNIVNRGIFNEIANRIGISVYENVSKTKSLSQLYLRSKCFSQFIYTELFVSEKGKDKTFNNKFLHQSNEVIEGIANGLFITDGCLDKDNRLNFDNTSLSLIGTYKILCSMCKDYAMGTDVRPEHIDSRGYHSKTSYKARRLKKGVIETNDYWLLPVKKIIRFPKTKTSVYDISVPYTNSFVLDNCVVHNSGVSFFLNKLLGFTSVDRISANVKMYPERFMSPTRILETHSLADIDMNVAKQEPFWEAQEELLGYDHSKQMIAFQQLKPAAAWKMYAKAQNVDYETSNEISKQIAKYLKDYARAKEEADDEEEIDIDILDYIDERYKDIYLKSEDYLGVVSAVSSHPCASLIYQGDIRKEIGYIYVKSESKKEGMVCCCMDGKWAEKYGFLKNDWLKVNVVEVIYKIFERIGMQPFSSTELIEKCKTDLEPWKLYKQRCTKGLNQVEQPSSSQKVGAYAPTNISELTAFVAAVRPGFKSMYDIFESRKHFDYNIPSFDRLLQTEEMPNSFVLYQEQSMATLNYAGIPMSECYAVIKAISKKRVDEITKNKPIFLKGFKERLQEEEKVSDERAEEAALQVWRIIEDGALYQFNASHAYSVALDSLYQAWLKAHYPLEFYETYLNILNEKGAKTRLNKFKQEAESYFRIKFPPYRFGQDNRKITIDKENNAINNALSSIKGYSNIVGETLYQCYFENIDFISVLKWLNERSIKAAKVVPLIKIGYFSEFGNSQALLTFMDCFDKLKQGNAKEVAKESVEKWFEKIISKHSNGLKKDGEPAKAWKILDIDEILEETLDYCINNIEEASYSTRMEWQNDILGYIELTTGKEEDIKKVLVLDSTPVVGKFSPDPWCYKVETRSIGTGRTATLNVYTKDYEKYGKLKKYDIIKVGRLEKNKKGYWYMFDYYQIDKGNKSDKINS